MTPYYLTLHTPLHEVSITWFSFLNIVISDDEKSVFITMYNKNGRGFRFNYSLLDDMVLVLKYRINLFEQEEIKQSLMETITFEKQNINIKYAFDEFIITCKENQK